MQSSKLDGDCKLALMASENLLYLVNHVQRVKLDERDAWMMYQSSQGIVNNVVDKAMLPTSA